MDIRFGFAVLTLSSAFLFQDVKAQGVSDKRIVKQLQADIGYLASDALEGRRTGSEGERKAADYIIARYKELDIPAYKGKYKHKFDFVNGKQVSPLTHIRIDGEELTTENVFPLPFSANGKVYGEIIPEVMEQGTIWMVPVFNEKSEGDDPHFDWEKEAFKRAREAKEQGATAVLFYDAYNAKYPPVYNAKSDYESVGIPVAFVNYKTFERVNTGQKSELKIEMDVLLNKVEMTGTNVAAYIDNNAPYTVVIGAHYDHLGFGEDGNSLNAKKDKQIHNGADDNASGTAALMQIGAWLKTNGLHHYNYLLVHFSGEELGLFGSKAFVNDEGIDSSKFAYMINMDMVGRLNDSTHALTIGGIGTSPVWPSIVDKSNKNFKIGFDTSGVGPSDHTSFYHKGIPALFFFTGTHHDYHKPSDDADKINYKGEASVMRYIYGVVEKMEKEPKPEFTTTKQTTMGKSRFKVTLGIMPDYTFQEGGVRVDGVIDDRPAVKAGVQNGDIIIQLGAHKINGMQTYMEALGAFNSGDKTEVTVTRDGKKITMPLEFK
jgi:aminopeptidase YwaD